MNIIIPLGGKGERFANNGYIDPKPLINIFEKRMIEYVLDNLNLDTNNNANKVFIIYNKKLDDYNFSTFINDKYPFIHLVAIHNTKGAVETLYLGIKEILKYSSHNKCLILDCDTFYTEDIVKIFKESIHNMVFYTKNDEVAPLYSYIELDSDLSTITHIKEKQKISDNANTGAYAFMNINELYTYCQYVLDNNITFKNEPYTSCVISEMIKSNLIFKGYELKKEHVFSLGTPEAVNQYQDNTYAFLFDLDGTLVVTDDIYFNVWYEILIKYNIQLNKELFTNYIQGNNDTYVSNTLLKNIELSIDHLSKMKDALFIKNIRKIKVIDGIYDIIHQIKQFGHKICIVTNCNQSVANEIIKYIHIDNFIDFVISSNDCIRGKPNPEPYDNAIKKYNINNNKCFIFEDSKTGLLSGKGVNPKLLIGIETIYNSNELHSFGVDMSIRHYINLSIHHLIHNNENNENYLKKVIKLSSTIANAEITDILIDDNKLKGGFIADVISFKIITNNDIHSQILKYENTQKNNLSMMAKKLKLYEREYYFYTNISNVINIKIPKFYNLVLDENDNAIGIVLENLLDKNYKNNLNLNIESIDVTLTIVDRMAKMHSKFWNKKLKKMFPGLNASNDTLFCPFFKEFIDERYCLFKQKWFGVLTHYQKEKCDEIYANFDKVQERFSTGNHLTFIHGDIKSPNIFYDIQNDNEPYFIDWQHCAIGKGVQDLIFFIIESFDIKNVKSVFHLSTEYYYKKIVEYGVTNYSMEEYEKDIQDALMYIPFFTSIWFGTMSQDELIDKNFPYFLICKMFYLIELTA